MRIPADFISPIWRLLIVSILVLFASFPSQIKAHSSGEAHASLPVALDYIAQDDEAFELQGHCHSGLDCFAAAVLVYAPHSGVQYLEAKTNYALVNYERDSWKHAFEPPPPRIRS